VDVLAQIRRLLIGRPLPTARQIHERLPKFLALPVFASDAMSSVAYATEEILLMLVVAGAAAWTVSMPIAVAIALLIATVAISYRQTIFAYPHGGGSYTVAKENLGPLYGLVAGVAAD
jgi:amino acid transporter